MSGADLEYAAMLARAGKTTADRLDAARLEQLQDTSEPVRVVLRGTGIDPTGVADSAAAIQAKIDTLSTTGGTVHVPEGDFRIASTLKLPSNVTLQGKGRASRIFTTTYMLSAIVSFETENVVVRDLYVEGDGKGEQPANTPTPTSDSLETSGCGISFMGVTRGLVENVHVYNFGGMRQGTDDYGISGIYLTYGCIDCTVRDCHVDTCMIGVCEDNFFEAAPYGNKFVNNTISNCRFGMAGDSADANTDTLFDGNTIRNCLQSGIDINKGNRVRVVNNHVSTCGTETGNSGIWVYGTATLLSRGVLVQGNTCVDNSGHGIKVSDNAFYTQVLGNRCYGNTKNGIFVLGNARYWTVANNHARENGESGIYAWKGDTGTIANGVLTGNTSENNGHHGIHLSGTQETAVANNVVKNNGTVMTDTYDGIRLSIGCTGCVFTGNVVRGAAHRYAIVGVDSDSKTNTFIGNDASGATTGQTVLVGQPNLELNYASTVPALLARTIYSPGVVTTPGNNTTTAADADSTNLAVTFIAPASGSVEVTLEAMTDIGTAANLNIWNLREGAADVAGTDRGVTRNTDATRERVTIGVSGLTPGASYTYKWGIRSNAAGVNARLLIEASTYGPAVMEVRAA